MAWVCISDGTLLNLAHYSSGKLERTSEGTKLLLRSDLRPQMMWEVISPQDVREVLANMGLSRELEKFNVKEDERKVGS
jgi:hypothetical protein